jgi:hypothetical protein
MAMQVSYKTSRVNGQRNEARSGNGRQEPPVAEPHGGWCGRTAGVTPPPTRSALKNTYLDQFTRGGFNPVPIEPKSTILPSSDSANSSPIKVNKAFNRSSNLSYSFSEPSLNSA